jgi:hypothetical protein
MKGYTQIVLTAFALYASVSAVPAKKAKASSAATTAAATATITRGASTIVMKEVGGIPGNECLTFRNNGKFSQTHVYSIREPYHQYCLNVADIVLIGEMVDAACVNTAADRQVTPSTSSSGANVLLVQRSFGMISPAYVWEIPNLTFIFLHSSPKISTE